MTVGWILLNLAYLVYVASSAFKDIVTLRVVLIAATVLFIAYGIVDGTWSIVWWNLPFGFMHAWQLARIWRERAGVNLDDEALAVRTIIFPELDKVDFNALWHLGTERTVSNAELTELGRPVDDLFLVLDGDIEVKTEERTFQRSARLMMIGEASMVRGSGATATVRALDDVRLRAWPKRELADLLRERPTLGTGFQFAIARDMSRKL